MKGYVCVFASRKMLFRAPGSLGVVETIISLIALVMLHSGHMFRRKAKI